VARTGDRARLGYVPNATYPQVADIATPMSACAISSPDGIRYPAAEHGASFLANYPKLQEMLNEICALNAELLRRRESLD
jgi:hypothetical protein